MQKECPPDTADKRLRGRPEPHSPVPRDRRATVLLRQRAERGLRRDVRGCARLHRVVAVLGACRYGARISAGRALLQIQLPSVADNVGGIQREARGARQEG